MANTPGYSVERGDQNNVKAVPPPIGQQLVQTGTPRFRAGNNIGVAQRRSPRKNLYLVRVGPKTG